MYKKKTTTISSERNRDRNGDRTIVGDRGQQAGRALRLACRLAVKGLSAREVAAETCRLEACDHTGGVCAASKMFTRDLQVLEHAGIPVHREEGYRFRVDRDFMKRFM